MKRILLYGATGRTGKHVLNYALEKEYEVTALVRNPNKLTIKSDKLTIIKGLPTNIDDVKKAIQGCDAVISTLSALSESELFTFKKAKVLHVLETAMRNTIKCMDEYSIKRIVTLSSIAVGNSYPYAPWYMRFMIKYGNFKTVFDDHNAQELLLMKSDLDWVIARPVGLNNDPEIKEYSVTYDKKPPVFKISRIQVAHFMVDALENDDFLHKAPVLSDKS